jgi:hypothetical protein
MSIDETFEYISRGETFNTANVPINSFAGRYEVRTWNTLYGVQTGGTLEYRYCRWTLDTHGKVGMYLNPAISDSHIQGFSQNPAVSIDEQFNSNNTVVAFAGEFGVHLGYKFTPNFVGHVAYDMMFVGDLARAPEQLQFIATPQPSIITGGQAFYNGVTVGCELDW